LNHDFLGTSRLKEIRRKPSGYTLIRGNADRGIRERKAQFGHFGLNAKAAPQGQLPSGIPKNERFRCLMGFRDPQVAKLRRDWMIGCPKLEACRKYW
jgi:hypothetical protein